MHRKHNIYFITMHNCTIALIPAFLNMECSYEDIYKIAGYDLDWMCVGRGLLNDQKVRESDHEGSIEGGKRDKVFLKWKRTMLRKLGYNATADLEELERKSKAQGNKVLQPYRIIFDNRKLKE